MKRRKKKKRSPRLHSEHILRDRNNSPERLYACRNRPPKNKHNPLCTETCGRYRTSGSSIRRDFPREGAGTVGKKKKAYSEEKIDRFADLANPSSGICKAAARHSRPSFHRSLRVPLRVKKFPPFLSRSLVPSI